MTSHKLPRSVRINTPKSSLTAIHSGKNKRASSASQAPYQHPEQD